VKCSEHYEVEAFFTRCYWSLKRAAARGGYLTGDELEHVGCVETPAPTDGWRSVWEGMPRFELGSDLSAADRAVLQALMVPERMEFLA
jgi:hypothetical protein